MIYRVLVTTTGVASVHTLVIEFAGIGEAETAIRKINTSTFLKNGTTQQAMALYA